MPICVDCDKAVSDDEAIYCYDCGSPLCAECGSIGLYSSCEEAMESEEYLMDEDYGYFMNSNL